MRALYKDFFREMRSNKGKFISVFFIILLGAAFFSGLRSSKPDMLLSAERYYDASNLHDICVMSTAGLTGDDLSALSALEGVGTAEGVYTLDVMAGGEDRSVVKLMSLTQNTDLPEVTEGEYPQGEGECLVDSLLKDIGGYSVGDTITFTSGDGGDLSGELTLSEYTISGFCNLPQYMDLNRGSGTIGNGDINGFVLLSPQAFKLGYYTQINILVDGAKAFDSFEEEYDGMISTAEQAINGISEEECARRYEELLAQFSGLPIPPDQLAALVPQPQWYVLDRSAIISCVNYRSDADRIASLGELLPIVFFLVAALVSLTAMTRLVEEERGQIGTFKAIGFGDGSVFVRYLLYALIPTLLGSVVGVLIGEKLFPFAILNTYSMLYAGLTSFVLPYNLVEGAIAVLAGVISTGIATIAACFNISREVPACIMRPVAPKPGKRVLLERVPFVWNRLGFTQKSTVRNLFRNKKRFIMTVIGIAGCMGLVLVGLGLHDSIMVVADMQFSELTHYQTSVTVQQGLTEEERTALISDFGGVSHLSLYQKSVDITGEGGVQTVSLTVPYTTEGIENYFTFRTRRGHNTVTIPSDGAIISEKTATSLGVSVGDGLTFIDGEYGEITLTISAIYENYIGHYIFISPGYFESITGEEPSCNLMLLTYPDESASFRDGLATHLLSSDGVQGVSFTSDLVEWADDTLSSLNTIVIIVLVAAALLAFVVLYNLNSINIAERKRELATLKVLGFHDKEVAMYIYKENIFLTIIGILLGIALGVLLHSYVITSIEVDMIMFGRNIFWYSYLSGALITFAFSVIVNLIMYRHIKGINMVESLKSAE